MSICQNHCQSEGKAREWHMYLGLNRHFELWQHCSSDIPSDTWKSWQHRCSRYTLWKSA